MAYKPTEYDIAWTKNLMRMLAKGGVWRYKTHNVLIKKRDSNTLIVLEGDEHVFKIFVMLEQLRAVLKECDINLVDERKPGDRI